MRNVCLIQIVTLKGATAIFVIEFEEVFNEIHTSIYK